MDDNEKELKRLLNYSKFANSDFIYKAFEHEFLHGNKIKVLNSPLLNYLYPDNNAILKNGHDLNDDDEDEEDDEFHSLVNGEDLIYNLIDAKKYEFLFRDEAVLFHKFFKSVLFDHESIQNLQEYILSNPEHLGHIHSYFHSLIDNGENDDIIEEWVCIALASNMPDWLFNGFPTHLFSTLDSKVFWTGIYIPKHLYNELFGRLNTIIGHFTFYSLLNAIRFGPEDSELYEPIMSLHRYYDDRMDLLCHCASLSNKKQLFAKLIRDKRTSFMKKFHRAFQRLDALQNIRIDLHKLLFDIHSILPLEYHQKFYHITDFISIVSYYCQVSSITWKENELIFEFNPPIESIESGFPERIFIHRRFNSSCDLLNLVSGIPEIIKFANEAVFEAFMLEYVERFPVDDDYRFMINGENLKLVLRSAQLRTIVSDNTDKFTFAVELKEIIKLVEEPDAPLQELTNVEDELVAPLQELTEAVDEPDVSLKNLIEVIGKNTKHLTAVDTAKKLKKLETIFGVSITDFLEPEFEYFMYRHVYRYLIESGQKLPDNLSENTKAMLEIDFPNIIVF